MDDRQGQDAAAAPEGPLSLDGTERPVRIARAGFFAGTLLLVGMVLAGLWLGWAALADIPNGPEPYEANKQWLVAAGAVAGVMLLGVAAAAPASGFQPLVRVSRLTGNATLASVALWILPMPFGVQRYLCFIIMAVVAAFYGMAALHAGLAKPEASLCVRKRMHRAFLGAAGLASAEGMVLLLAKFHALGWEASID